ncbi:MAG: hypothetical protein HFJ79_08485 [Clostridiales bacterium]|nr:hypothetical protein [Clostridiales bacterium]
MKKQGKIPRPFFYSFHMPYGKSEEKPVNSRGKHGGFAGENRENGKKQRFPRSGDKWGKTADPAKTLPLSRFLSDISRRLKQRKTGFSFIFR